jgi:hypothetical protein
MSRKKRKHQKDNIWGNSLQQGSMPPSTPMIDVFRSFIDYEKDLDVLAESTINAHETRLMGKNNIGPVLMACSKAGLKCTGDISKVPFRLINKEIERIALTRAQANNLKSSLKKSLECNVLLGNIVLPPGAIRGVRQQKNRPCAPVQLTDVQIDFFRKSKKGRTPFLAARNDLIGEFELLYAIRPGLEITMIDDANVHAREGYMDILRDDGLMQRIYLRRDTCDRVMVYRRLRHQVIKNAGITEQVIPFFIKERNI